MRIRPPILELAHTALLRRHRPKRRKRTRYSSYRPCLRWEFGFTCAICWLHETDFSPAGIEGLAVTSIEHVTPQSRSKAKRHLYSNCIYVCRMCNTARSNRPIRDSRGRRLLDPTKDPWSSHFHFVGDQLVAKAGDQDASYTAEAYDVADERKTKLRGYARRFIVDRLNFIKWAKQSEGSLLLAASLLKDPAEAMLVLNHARELRARAREAFQQVCAYKAVPMDAPGRCACSGRPSRLLSTHLTSQVLLLRSPG